MRLGVASIEFETTSEFSRQLNFFPFEKTNRADASPRKAAPRQRRPRVICIAYDQILPKIGAAGPALAAGPWVSPQARGSRS
jgi:hypothetical protein